jgi:hypothetical protein
MVLNKRMMSVQPNQYTRPEIVYKATNGENYERLTMLDFNSLKVQLDNKKSNFFKIEFP